MNPITDFKVTIPAPPGHRNMPAYCAEHDCVASLWSDGSGNCEYCRVAEIGCECALTECALVPVDAMEKVRWCVEHGSPFHVGGWINGAPRSICQAAALLDEDFNCEFGWKWLVAAKEEE